MPLTFTEADRLFQNNLISELSAEEDGKRFLKLRSLSRAKKLEALFRTAGVPPPEVGTRQLFESAFEARIPTATVEGVIRDIYRGEREERCAREPELLNQLYRVAEFNWRGLRQGALERTIVDKYVKKITDYEELCSCVENELLLSMRGYVICTWYNHWTSIVIEDIFNDHANVLPAVGRVKNIDFFVKDVPFDLKVTYLPEECLGDKRKQAGLRPELTLLKRQARQNAVPIDNNLPNAALGQDLWAKISDHPAAGSRGLIAELTAFRNDLVKEVEQDPAELIRWLYENQEERRFDASNRLYLVLVDQRNYFESWKLKRAKPLMEAKISRHLDECGPGRRVTFRWKGQEYSAVSDMIVVRQTPL
jgi:hypothetical protein